MVNYTNVTTAVGIMWAGNSSTIATGAAFTIEASGSTNQLLLRNLWLPANGTSGFGSTDIYIQDVSGGVTASVLAGSGFVNSFNSFYFLISSVHVLRLVNNTGSTHSWTFDGIVVRV